MNDGDKVFYGQPREELTKVRINGMTEPAVTGRPDQSGRPWNMNWIFPGRSLTASP